MTFLIYSAGLIFIYLLSRFDVSFSKNSIQVGLANLDAERGAKKSYIS
jgi:hypothetical protein